MAGWLQDLWGKASDLWGEASERIEEAQGEQEQQEEKEKAAEDSLRQVEARQRREAEDERRRTNVRRKQMRPADFQAWQAQERELQTGGESFEGFGGEVPGEQSREQAADESLREVGRGQDFRLQPIGTAGIGGHPDQFSGRGAGADRTNEQILEALEAIRDLLEESKEILQEIKEKEPAGATWGP